jgi:hypothetical protein
VRIRAASLLVGLALAVGMAGAPPASAQDQALSPSATENSEALPPVPGRPGREISLPESEVKDTFFAYFLGIISSGTAVDMDNEQMRAVLTEFKATLDVPFDLVSRVTQGSGPGGGGQVIGLEFAREVVIPVPFALLFYHPGSIFASRFVSLDVQRLPWTDPVVGGPPGTAFDLVLARGTVLVDIDDWLEALFSAHLEDAWIRHIVFFKWSGDWIGMLTGFGRSTGRPRRAYFDFTKNRILFPAGDELNRSGQRFVPG